MQRMKQEDEMAEVTMHPQINKASQSMNRDINDLMNWKQSIQRSRLETANFQNSLEMDYYH